MAVVCSVKGIYILGLVKVPPFHLCLSWNIVNWNITVLWIYIPIKQCTVICYYGATYYSHLGSSETTVNIDCVCTVTVLMFA